MAAAAAVVCRAGAPTIALVPGYDRTLATPFVDVVLLAGMGYARNVLVVAAGDVVIALPGEHGTGSEVALALTRGKPGTRCGALK